MSLYNQGADALEISKSLELDASLVKLVVARHDSTGDRDITDDQLVLLRNRAYQLAMQDECIPVAARMTEFLIERDKPKDKVQVSPITAINNALIIANDQFKKLAEGFATQEVVLDQKTS